MQPSVPVFVGLDYSQHAVQVCILDPAGKVLCNARCPDEADRIYQLARRFGTVRGAALEACTGAADLAQELADRFAWPMHLGHPGFVSRMKQSPDKTDFSDARVLADLERVGYLPRVWIAPRPLRELRTLVRDRQLSASARKQATTSARTGDGSGCPTRGICNCRGCVTTGVEPGGVISALNSTPASANWHDGPDRTSR